MTADRSVKYAPIFVIAKIHVPVHCTCDRHCKSLAEIETCNTGYMYLHTVHTCIS